MKEVQINNKKSEKMDKKNQNQLYRVIFGGIILFLNIIIGFILFEKEIFEVFFLGLIIYIITGIGAGFTYVA